ncbi:MAG: helix-turn-helix domain-containing protein [Bacteroidales bacterium]|nr:helix-turn-helix domain-containing protein [Bacteroidales bacterium]
MITKYTIAILPFRDLSYSSENEYLSDGITEEILNALVKIDGLAVTARTSSFYYKEKEIDIEKIGNELKVQAILKGSVKVITNKIRINVQLINTHDYFHIWSEGYEQGLDDVFALQNRISHDVAEKIREYYGHFEIDDNLNLQEIDNFKAYNLYLKGKFYLNKWNFESTKKAIEIFQEVIKIEPNYAPAFSGLSNCYTFLGITGQISPKETYVNAKKYAEKSLLLNNQLSDTYLAQAYISFWYEWDFSSTYKYIYKALKISPGAAEIHRFYAMVLIANGKKEEALKEIETAIRLDPLSVHSNYCNGVINNFLGNFDMAIKHFNSANSFDPYFSSAHVIKAYSYIYKNKVEEAIKLFERIPLGPENYFQEYGGLGYSYAILGKTDKAEYYLEKLNKAEDVENIIDIEQSKLIIYLALNRFDEAQIIFEKEFEKRSPGLIFSNVDPLFKPILKLPCYKKFENILENGTNNYQPSYSKYKTSGLNKQEAKKYNEQLLKYMDAERPYLDSSLSLNSLAKLLNVNSNYLSQVINEHQQKNFFDFVNTYRINYFIEQWKDPKNKGFTLLALAYSSGFNSKTAFNASFKKIIGQSPTQYLKSL